MRFLENRVIAWVVLAVCVVGSVVGLGGAAMARERAQIMKVYSEGAKDRGAAYCMTAYLDRAAECAQIMASEVQLRLGENANANAMLEAVRLYEENSDPTVHARAYRDMCSLADQLYNAIYGASLPEGEKTSFKTAYDDFWGADKMIEKDPYLEMAAEFNDDREAGFLSGLVCGAAGVGELCDDF